MCARFPPPRVFFDFTFAFVVLLPRLRLLRMFTSLMRGRFRCCREKRLLWFSRDLLQSREERQSWACVLLQYAVFPRYFRPVRQPQGDHCGCCVFAVLNPRCSLRHNLTFRCANTQAYGTIVDDLVERFIGLGITPEADTYRALLLAYSKGGDADKVCF